MEASCSKNVTSSSEFSKSFTGSDESVYSETSSETNSDSYHSDQYFENEISQDLSAAMDSQKNQNNDDQWIQIADQPSDVIRTAIDFSPINTPGPLDCVSQDSKPHDYFYIYLGKNS